MQTSIEAELRQGREAHLGARVTPLSRLPGQDLVTPLSRLPGQDLTFDSPPVFSGAKSGDMVVLTPSNTVTNILASKIFAR